MIGKPGGPGGKGSLRCRFIMSRKENTKQEIIERIKGSLSHSIENKILGLLNVNYFILLKP